MWGPLMDFALLQRINAEVNILPYKADPADFDDWSPIDEKGGDCDSYAVAKLRRLVAAGVPVESLRLATCYVEPSVGTTKDERYHAVLIVSTQAGDFMLDNRQHFPTPVLELAMLGYEPALIQKIGGEQGWAEWKGAA